MAVILLDSVQYNPFSAEICNLRCLVCYSLRYCLVSLGLDCCDRLCELVKSEDTKLTFGTQIPLAEL